MNVLGGRRILVTRASADQESFASFIRARGAVPIPFPCIEFAPPDEPLGSSVERWVRAPPAAVALASPQAADRFAALFPQREDLQRLAARTVIAAAGEGTARTLAAHGIAAIHPGAEAGAGPLAALLIERLRDRLHANDLAAPRVLLPQAAEATPLLAEKLREAGFAVEAAALYKTVPIVNFSAEHEPGLEMLRAQRIDAIAFASGSAARGFAKLVGPPPIAMLANTRGARVACIGESTAVEARALGFSVAAVGSGGFDSMLDALAACYPSEATEDEETA